METRVNAGRRWLPVTNTGQRVPVNVEAVNVGTGDMQSRPIDAATIETRPVQTAAPAPAAPLTVVQAQAAMASPAPATASAAATIFPTFEPAPGPNLELAVLQEKLAFYEAFDQLINDNVARSAELFRSLYEERERLRGETNRNRAEVEAAAQLEAERRLASERERMQGTLMSLMDEASRMQRQVDGLIQRIAEAITEFTVWLPDDADQRQAS